MIKLIPLSLVLVSIIVPMHFATRPRPKRALRQTQIAVAVFALFWALLNLYVYPRYVLPE